MDSSIAKFDCEIIINLRPERNARENHPSNRRAHTASVISKFGDAVEQCFQRPKIRSDLRDISELTFSLDSLQTRRMIVGVNSSF